MQRITEQEQQKFMRHLGVDKPKPDNCNFMLCEHLRAIATHRDECENSTTGVN